ncbi:MAG: hypothetical protein NTV52_36900, partial [Acidobacteria bacterium]|nr:hypothetical protein [Acidobacteriota bacterium]
MKKLSAILFVALLANTAYIAAFASPTIFYMANVLLHLVLGSALFLIVLRYLPRPLQLLSVAVFLTGAWLIWAGAVTENQKILWAHMAVGTVAAMWGLYVYRRPL